MTTQPKPTPTAAKRTLAEYRNERKLAAMLAAKAPTGRKRAKHVYELVRLVGDRRIEWTTDHAQDAHRWFDHTVTTSAPMVGGAGRAVAVCLTRDGVPIKQAMIEAASPALLRPPPEIADSAKVRLGDGFISAEFPPLPAKVERA